MGTELSYGTLLFGSVFPALVCRPLHLSSASSPPSHAHSSPSPGHPAALFLLQTLVPKPSTALQAVTQALCNDHHLDPSEGRSSFPHPPPTSTGGRFSLLLPLGATTLHTSRAHSLPWPQLTFVGEGTGGATGEVREGVGITGATSGV